MLAGLLRLHLLRVRRRIILENRVSMSLTFSFSILVPIPHADFSNGVTDKNLMRVK
jgi:hypothetical protein